MEPTVATPNQTLEAVRDFATRMQPDIFLFGDEAFGRFLVSPHIVFNRDNPHFEYSTEDGLYVKVDLDMTRDKTQVGSIAVLMDGNWWSVDPYNIICKTNPDHEREINFPAFELRWIHHDREPERKGTLEYVSFRAAHNEGVFYSYLGNEEKRHIYNLDPEKYPVPESLIGATELQGRKLGWKIDTNAMELEIIQRSAIYEFMASVPFRDGTWPEDPAGQE